MELQHWWHWKHPLAFNEDERSGSQCNGCSEPVFGPSYSCKECREGSRSIHHKSCAELPLGLHHPSHPNHPLILIGKYKYYDNKEEYNKFSKCDVCGERSREYSYFCYRCNFNIHIRCSSLSLTIQTEVHDHQLTRSIWKLMKFTCDFCGKEGNLPYFCAQCDFAIHSRCAACPRILKVFRHNHPLHLTPSLEVHQSDSPICLLCVRKVDTLCLYYCSRCDFVAHLYCAMLSHNREYINLQELKEEQSTESKSEDSELHQSFDSEICKVIETIVGEDGTEIAIEIKHFSHEHDLKLTDEIPNNTKCNGQRLVERKSAHPLIIPMTALGVIFMDKFGQPLLLLVSAAGTCLGCFLVGLSLFLQDLQTWTKITPILALVGFYDLEKHTKDKMEIKKSKCQHKCLKVVELISFVGCGVDMEIAKYILILSIWVNYDNWSNVRCSAEWKNSRHPWLQRGNCIYSRNNPQKSPRRIYYCASVMARPLRNFTYFVGTVVSWRTLALIGTILCLAQLIGLLLFLNLQDGWKIQFKWNVSP
ncbi:hypothetical protein CMV_021422 [Castanea mollissima]|uniref:DC1 domain-containing protein n=2 Tax=Castanea mollissima TaxID=60419 RepID=A0A8J4QX89_9ROSI|nr:hypothetical protein CMV_021422 [Castanea mollissima]